MEPLTAHCAVIEAGPGTIRRLCCATSGIGDAQLVAAALSAIDDAVVLVDDRPVDVASAWSSALRAVFCGDGARVVVLHPSWWSASRVNMVTAAAQMLSGDVVVRPRSWLLAQAVSEAAVVVEIAGQLVLVAGDEPVGVARVREPQSVVDEVAGVVAEIGATAVVVDGPTAVPGAPQLATMIADAVRRGGHTAVRVDDARLLRLAGSLTAAPDEPRPAAVRRRYVGITGLVGAAAVVAVSVLAMPHRDSHRVDALPATTSLIEGRVALTVPADWATQRVLSGPGSARVQVTSPLDPEVALHLTQSAVAGETLTAAAERLKRAIDAEPTGVFVDFDPHGASAGRPAVTYREVRTAHDVRWTVLLDAGVRISIGCQSRPAAPDAVRDACDRAVRSAHALE